MVWVELLGDLAFLQTLTYASQSHQQKTQQVVCLGVVGAQESGSSKFGLGPLPVQKRLPFQKSQPSSCFRIIGIELQSSLQGLLPDGYVFARPSQELLMSGGQPHVGGRKIGVGVNRLLKVPGGLVLFFLAGAFAITAQ